MNIAEKKGANINQNLSQDTKDLIEKKPELAGTRERVTVEFTEINKLITMKTKQDIQNHNEENIKKTIEENKRLLRRKLNSNRNVTVETVQ